MKSKWVSWLWDSWCLLSLVGIWPRFIEPRLLAITKVDLFTARLCSKLNGLKILQFSDLHWNRSFSPAFQSKIIHKMKQLKPDLIVFTGDFIVRSQLQDREGLLSFLNKIKAPYGCFAVLGNHDYASYVTINENGDYDIEKEEEKNIILRGFKRLFFKTKLSRKISKQAKEIAVHSQLKELLSKTSFQLLHNENRLLQIKGCLLNICGLGEYMLGDCLPKKAFFKYQQSAVGIILTHNPDAIPSLLHYPGEYVLCGHTHGGQVNLPWIWKRLTKMEQLKFKRGLKQVKGKQIYINRGVGSQMQFRWFSLPELTLFTLKAK